MGKGGWFVPGRKNKSTGGEWFSGREEGSDDYAKDQQGGDNGKGRKDRGMKSNVDGEGFSWWDG